MARGRRAHQYVGKEAFSGFTIDFGPGRHCCSEKGWFYFLDCNGMI